MSKCRLRVVFKLLQSLVDLLNESCSRTISCKYIENEERNCLRTKIEGIRGVSLKLNDTVGKRLAAHFDHFNRYQRLL